MIEMSGSEKCKHPELENCEECPADDRVDCQGE